MILREDPRKISWVRRKYNEIKVFKHSLVEEHIITQGFQSHY